MLNARDLGGLRTRDGGRTREKSLLRTDDLYRLTPEGMRALLAYGVTTVPRAIAAAPSGAVLLHCAAGKDRTGVIAAVILAAADVEPSEIAADYAVSTEYIREAYLAAHPREYWDAVLEDVRCPPEQVHNTIAHLDSR